MLRWYGYAGRWITDWNETKRWEAEPGAFSNRTMPAVGQWFFGTDEAGKRTESLYVKVFDREEEAQQEYQQVLLRGGFAVLWSPRTQQWESPAVSSRAQGCGGCSKHKQSKCAGRREGVV